jgi:hypothetical protein
MKRAFLAAAIAVAFSAGVLAQGKPNFAGKWIMDAEKTAAANPGGAPGGGAPGNRGAGMGAPAPLTITVDGNKMTITRTMGENTISTVYLLDGTPSKNMQRGQGGEVEVTYTSKWEGNTLVTTIVNPRGTSTEKRSLAEDGTMIIESTRTAPDGTARTAKTIFRRDT